MSRLTVGVSYIRLQNVLGYNTAGVQGKSQNPPLIVPVGNGDIAPCVAAGQRECGVVIAVGGVVEGDDDLVAALQTGAFPGLILQQHAPRKTQYV